MKILVVCQYYYPEQFRINDICEKLVQMNHQVTVLTGLPNYPSGIVSKEYKHCKKRKEIINGVNVIRTFEIGRKKGAIHLLLNYISFMISSSWKARFLKNEYDLIFSYQLSPITMVKPACILKKRFKKPLYIYVCDIWPDSAKNIIKNEKSYIYKIIQRFSQRMYRGADMISIPSKDFIQYFENIHKISKEKLNYIPQHAESTYLNLKSTIDNGIIDFVFMGNIGIVQDIDCIINAVNEIKNMKGFLIHFVGDGSYLETSKLHVKEKGLEDFFIFHGRHPLEEMDKYYTLADACLLTLKDEGIVGKTIPSKLQGYMAAGKMIIGAINGPANEIINEAKCGICVKASDYISLAKIMANFISNQNQYNSYGENGRKYFLNHFTIDIYMNNLVKVLDKLHRGEENV